MAACMICNASGLLAAGIVDDCCPLCNDVDENACRIEEKEAVATTSNRSGRAALAAQTLRVHTQGGYWHEHQCVNIEPMLRHAIRNTVLYPSHMARAASRADCVCGFGCEALIEVTEETTVEAGRRLHVELGAKAGGALCVLNFASAKNPGGGFQGGSLAQEESLALSSGLYACLVPHMNDFYTPHRNDPDRGLYSHTMLYSPRVPFFRDDSGNFSAVWCSGVITAPAPNAGVAHSKNVSEVDLIDTLRERCGRILAIAQEQGHTHLVLGAFGCGVFRNDPTNVAMAFDYWLRGSGMFAHAFRKVVFAIPLDAHNFPVFSAYFSSESLKPRAIQRFDKHQDLGAASRKGHADAAVVKKKRGGCGPSRKDKHLQKFQYMDDAIE